MTLVGIAPVTNLALALMTEPTLTDHISQIVLMSGAWAEGNAAAEFNAVNDPEALAVLLGCGRPVVFATLELTAQALVTPDRLGVLRALGSGLCLAAACDIQASVQPSRRLPGAPLHDPCAIAWLLRPELFTSVTAQMSARLNFSDRTEAITTVAELLAVLCQTDAFDIAYCRNVLQHLSRPVDLLRTMGAAVHPGGVVVAEDADFEGSFCYPPNAAFDFWVTAYQRALRSAGGDPQSGRQLHERFVQAGLPSPELSVVQQVNVTGEAKSMPYRTIATTRETIVGAGIATDAEVDDALAGLAALAADDTTVVGSPRLLQAWASKPGPA